jgi:hypothetical protein
MLTGGRADYAAFAIAALTFLIVMLVSYFCLELREAHIRATESSARRADRFAPKTSWTTGPLPEIEPDPCPCDATGMRRGACNCCSASIVPP